MKRLMLMAAGALAGTWAWGVQSVNAWGLLKIQSSTKETVVSVPWIGLDAKGDAGTAPVDVSTLVRTTNLQAGDRVMAVRADGVYQEWTLDANGVWQSEVTAAKKAGGAQQVQFEAPAATERTVSRGLAIWVIRNGENRDLSKPFYVAGQYASSAAATEIAGGTASAPAWTLLMNPDGSATDLNAIAWQNGTDEWLPLATDQIAVTSDSGAKALYSWSTTSHKWGKTEYVQNEENGIYYPQRNETAVVPADRGIWYVRKGAGFTFSWPTAKSADAQ